MKLQDYLNQMPKNLEVNVKKGNSGVLIAELPQLDAITEAGNLNELFFQVNDLIYTYYDIPKKLQDGITYCPNRTAREDLIKVAKQKTTDKSKKFKLTSYYTEELYERIFSV